MIYTTLFVCLILSLLNVLLLPIVALPLAVVLWWMEKLIRSGGNH